MRIQRGIHDAGYNTRDFAVAELGLGLPLELGLGQFDADHGGQAFAHIISGKRFPLELLDQIRLSLDIRVNGTGQSGFEPGQVRSALNGTDIVGKGVDIFLVLVVILESELHGDVVRDATSGNNGVDGMFAAVKILHELTDPALGVILVRFIGALVHADDSQPLIKIGQLFKTLLEHGKGKFGRFKNLIVRQKTYRSAMAFGFPQTDQLRHRRTALVTLSPALAVTAHSDLKPFRQRVYAGYAHPVQAAGHLVGVVVKLASGVQFGHDHLYGGHAELGMNIHGNAASVVAHGDTVVHVQDHFHMGAVSGHGLVNGVIHHFIDKMMQPVRIGTAYIHGRALAHRRQTFQNGNGGSVVG